MIERELEFIRRHGYAEPVDLKIGVMLEVPSLLWQLDQLLPKVDFVSVGSNDLMQFVFASDRSNVHMTDRYDTLSPAFLRLLRHVVLTTEKYKVPLTLCGEMAGRPLEAMALIGLGFRSLSMSSAYVGPIKSMLLSLNATEIQDYVLSGLDTNVDSLRSDLEAFAKDKQILI